MFQISDITHTQSIILYIFWNANFRIDFITHQIACTRKKMDSELSEVLVLFTSQKEKCRYE